MIDRGRILVVDDEDSIRYLLAEELVEAGYQVSIAASGEEALAHMRDQETDLVVLDLKMGGMDGLQVMDEMGDHPLPPQFVILTGHATLDSAVAAMRKGGCDYLSKPCRSDDLLASVERGLARRREALQRCRIARLIEETARQLYSPDPQIQAQALPTQPRVLQAREVLLDLNERTAMCRGAPLSLTPTEFEMLACLMARAGRPVSYCDLATAMYGDGTEWTEWDARASLSTHMWRLRQKLSADAEGQPYIVNVRARGYKFQPGA